MVVNGLTIVLAFGMLGVLLVPVWWSEKRRDEREGVYRQSVSFWDRLEETYKEDVS